MDFDMGEMPERRTGPRRGGLADLLAELYARQAQHDERAAALRYDFGLPAPAPMPVVSQGLGALSDVTRSRFLRPLTSVASSITAGLLDLEQMAHPVLSASQLDHFQQFIRLCGERRRTTSLDVLIPAAEATYRRLRELVVNAPSGTAARACMVAAEAALLTGRLHYFAGRHGDAYGALSFADVVGQEAGADQIRAAAYVAMSYLRSPLTRIEAGNSDRTMMLLNSAAALSSPDISPLVHTWILARRAEEQAARSDELAALSDMEVADRTLSRGVDDDAVVTGPRSQADLDGFRGTVLIHLGKRGAGDMIERSLASLPDSMLPRRAHSLADLAVARAHEGQVEAACSALAAAITAARPLGRMTYIRRALAVRRRDLRRWEGSTAVAELDEQIAAYDDRMAGTGL